MKREPKFFLSFFPLEFAIHFSVLDCFFFSLSRALVFSTSLSSAAASLTRSFALTRSRSVID